MSKVLKLRAAILLLDLFDLMAFLFFVVGIVLTVRFFVFNPFTVVGQSMESTFSQGDFIIVDKITPKYGELERYDILVFVPDGKDVPFIKRLIGLPNETIVIENGNLYICDDEDLVDIDLTQQWLQAKDIDVSGCDVADDSYLDEETVTRATSSRSVFPIDADGYFMVGDNRWGSTDSRACFGGTCYKGANYLAYPNDIVGKVAVRLYPSIDKY